MAAGAIVGVSPAQGLYAAIVGPVVGGLTARSELMMISTTGAASLATFEVVHNVDEGQRLGALVLVTLFVGLFLAIAAGLGLARLTSFVSHSVMTGFMTGVGVLIVLGQLGTLFGYDAHGSNSIAKLADLIQHVSSTNTGALALGCLSMVLLIGAKRSKIGPLGPLLALAIPSLIASLAGLNVEKVGDISAIPSSLPFPQLPDFSQAGLSLVTGAIAVAAIVLVQTSGVSQSLPGASAAGVPGRDLAAAGLANIGSALFRGIPVSASLGQSALSISAGARTRLASISCGLLMLVAMLLIAGLVEQVVMSTLAGLLIVSAAGSIDVREGLAVWRTGWMPRLTVALTFCLTLVLPIQLAVGVGVLASALLYLTSSAADVRLVCLSFDEAGRLLEGPPPDKLPSNSVTILQAYGSLFFAGARTMAKKLPNPTDSYHSVVILRLRGKTRAGATAIEVLTNYAERLKQRGGRLYLAGLTPELKLELTHNGKLALAHVHLFEASRLQGRSVTRSYRAATTWLVRPRQT